MADNDPRLLAPLNDKQLEVWKVIRHELTPTSSPQRIAREYGTTEWTVRRIMAVKAKKIAKAEAKRDKSRKRTDKKRGLRPNEPQLVMSAPSEPSNAMHIVIPDAHAMPGCDKSRFVALGKLINMRVTEAMILGVPARVIQLGDFGDFEALSSYDRGKKSFESRRYRADVEAVNHALQLIDAELDPQVKEYAEFHALTGNHEHRANRFVNDNPELEGWVKGMGDLHFEHFGWQVHPFLKPVVLDGVAYAHYFVSGVMGRAISGVNPGRAIVTKALRSCTAGHNHLLSHHRLTTATGDIINGLTAGCFFEEVHGYAKATHHMYWIGLIVKHGVNNGDYDMETIRMSRLRDMVAVPKHSRVAAYNPYDCPEVL